MTPRLRTFEALFLLFVVPALFLAACGDDEELPFTTPGARCLHKKSAIMPTQEAAVVAAAR